MDFYITLPSNVKNEYFDNKVANFKTKLATKVKLEGDWSVGISSVSYTKSWNIKHEIGEVKIIYYDWFHIREISPSIIINLDDVSSVEDIISFLNAKFEDLEKLYFKFPRIIINKKTNRIEIIHTLRKNALVSLRLSNNLSKILGFDSNRLNKKNWEIYEEYKKQFHRLPKKVLWSKIDSFEPESLKPDDLIYSGEEPYNLFESFYSLYIYCDIVKHSLVGDSFTQLLRIVEIPPISKFRDQILLNYSNIHYIPLLINEFDTIEIQIKDDLGELIPFLFGRTIITLHFKNLK